jgi:N-acetylglucosaminyldiphosphoundecaprenol N-acetyl-beta-D-mannosaminyltransferase
MFKSKNNPKITPISGQKYAQIFNIGLNSTSTSQVLRFLRYRISKAEKFFVITPNPEILLEANRDKKYAQVLNSADLAIPDGIALLAANKFLNQPTIKPKILSWLLLFYKWTIYFYIYTFNKEKLENEFRLIKGRKLFEDLVKLANKKSWKVVLLGGKDNEAEETVKKLKLNYKRAKFLALAGPILDDNANTISERDREIEIEAVKKINEFQPQILFVGLGAPKQEKWSCKWFGKLSVGGIMVVGGTFRYISGQAKLPPKWMEELGLEWMWRVLTEPWRIGRIFQAVIIFPLKVFLFRFKNLK